MGRSHRFAAPAVEARGACPAGQPIATARVTAMDDDITRRLHAAASAARANAYAPYSRFRVGAALLGGDGRIYAGANVENAAYPQGQCAEASAIGAMVAAGCTEIVRVLVVAEAAGGQPVGPCGGCRQRLREFAADTVRVQLASERGITADVALGELLPMSFGPEHLAG